ncbi:hypothetical protein ACFWHW_12140 [Streptomyces pharetrae]
MAGRTLTGALPLGGRGDPAAGPARPPDAPAAEITRVVGAQARGGG